MFLFCCKPGSPLTEKITVPKVFPVMFGSLEKVFCLLKTQKPLAMITTHIAHAAHSVGVWSYFSRDLMVRESEW